MESEIERRWLISSEGFWPDSSVLPVTTSKIIQLYLNVHPPLNSCVKSENTQVTHDAVYNLLTHEVKMPSGVSGYNLEIVRAISADEYTYLITHHRDTTCHPIVMTRRYFHWRLQKWKIDAYPQDLTILACELSSPDELSLNLALPPWLTIEEEITNNDLYSNYELAKSK